MVASPGLGIHYSFKFLTDDTFFTLFPEKHKVLNLFHLHLVGGRSIVLRRYLEVGASFLKDVSKKYFVERCLSLTNTFNAAV